ncbi:MAG: DUF4440 domain-containing protein [Pyrinomonadaceae bacterium]
MKRCPTCNKTFTDRNLSFCIDDGTPLVPVDQSAGDEAETLLLPGNEEQAADPLQTVSSGRRTVPRSAPPGSYVPPGSSADVPAGRQKRRTWPWLMAILVIVLLVFAGLGIGGALLIPRLRTALSNRDNPNSNTNVERSANSNSESGSAEDKNRGNDSIAGESGPPPTNEDEVLTDLTNLEHEWTVANINADKKKLNRILADDYVGTLEGKPQGKADYLRTVERDTTIEKWDFEDLRLILNGDRATLTGVIRLVVQDQKVAYRFTDKFVWRDNRWQATGSEVSPLSQEPEV